MHLDRGMDGHQQFLASAPGYAMFELKAKRKRVEIRIAAAREAIFRRQLGAAAAALDEVIEIDPRLPELAGLTADFDDLRREVSSSHGPWIAAAVVFVCALFAVA